MTELEMVLSERNKDIVMTREQIGMALEYSPDPANSIAKIHHRHNERLDHFSGVVKLSTPSGIQDVTVYSAKGIYEICRWSKQPKAIVILHKKLKPPYNSLV